MRKMRRLASGRALLMRRLVGGVGMGGLFSR
jgi:hypothetical protein